MMQMNPNGAPPSAVDTRRISSALDRPKSAIMRRQSMPDTTNKRQAVPILVAERPAEGSVETRVSRANSAVSLHSLGHLAHDNMAFIEN